MKYFIIMHVPTKGFFPYLRNGSSSFDFYAPTKKRNVPPRLFPSHRFASRYITEYCKGTRNLWEFGSNEPVIYSKDKNRRQEDFVILTVTLTATFGEAA